MEYCWISCWNAGPEDPTNDFESFLESLTSRSKKEKSYWNIIKITKNYRDFIDPVTSVGNLSIYTMLHEFCCAYLKDLECEPTLPCITKSTGDSYLDSYLLSLHKTFLNVPLSWEVKCVYSFW